MHKWTASTSQKSELDDTHEIRFINGQVEYWLKGEEIVYKSKFPAYGNFKLSANVYNYLSEANIEYICATEAVTRSIYFKYDSVFDFKK